MTPLVLVVLGLLLAGPVPAGMARAPRLRATPVATLLLWQSVAAAAVLSALGAGVALATERGSGGEHGLASVLVAVLALALTGVVLARLLLAGHRVGMRLRRHRRRHRKMVDLLGDPWEDVGATRVPVRVVPHEAPTAYCIPGLASGRVVVSSGALDALTSDQRAAVLAHEQAHLRARHDLVVEAFTVLSEAFPAVLSSSRALREVRLLVEIVADQAAIARVGVESVAGALVALTSQHSLGTPEAPQVDDDQLIDRVEALAAGRREGRVQRIAVMTASTALLVLPTVLIVLPWVGDHVG